MTMRDLIKIVEAAQRSAADRYIRIVNRAMKRIGTRNIIADLEAEGDARVALNSIDAAVPGHGYGSRAMRIIIKHADTVGITLTLAVTSENSDPEQDRLIRWYGRYGFVVTGAEPFGDLTWFDLERVPR